MQFYVTTGQPRSEEERRRLQEEAKQRTTAMIGAAEMLQLLYDNACAASHRGGRTADGGAAHVDLQAGGDGNSSAASLPSTARCCWRHLHFG